MKAQDFLKEKLLIELEKSESGMAWTVFDYLDGTRLVVSLEYWDKALETDTIAKNSDPEHSGPTMEERQV